MKKVLVNLGKMIRIFGKSPNSIVATLDWATEDDVMLVDTEIILIFIKEKLVLKRPLPLIILLDQLMNNLICVTLQVHWITQVRLFNSLEITLHPLLPRFKGTIS